MTRSRQPHVLSRALLVAWMLLAPAISLAATCTSKATGNWNSATTWTCSGAGAGTIPANTDTVVLVAPWTVSLNNNDRTVAALTINAGATLNDDGQNLTVNGNVINNGTFGTNGGALIMRGTNSTLSGTGAFNETDVQADASGISIPAGSTMSFTNGAQLRVGRDNPGTFTLNGTIDGTGMTAGDRILRVYENSSATINGTINAPNAYIRIEQNATLTNNGSVTVQYLDSDGNNSTAVWTQGANSSLTLSQTPTNTWRGTLNASATGNTVTYTADVTPLTPSANTYYNIGHPVCAKVSGFTILGSSPCGPMVSSINRASADPTSPGVSVSWTVTFSDSVTGVNTTDFALVQAGSVSGATILSVTGNGTTWTVAANTGSGSGTLGLNLVDDDSIVNAGNAKLGGVGSGNGNFTGQVYTVNGPAVCTTALTGVVNTYYPPAAAGTVAAGATAITLGTSTGNATPLAANDLVLIIQMQDATIDATNTNAYGATTLGNSGLYEYKVVQSFSAGVVTFTSALANSYTSAAATAAAGQKTYQVIRVPVLASYTLSTAPTALAWNGSVGGVLAFDVTGALNLNSVTVDVSGKGFRGGAGRSLTGTGTGTSADYRTLATNRANGSKGEGSAGTPRYVNNAGALLDTTVEGYPNGSYGKGAPANAGGGGTDDDGVNNDENTGGGGGANGGAGGMGGYGWSAPASPGRGIGGATVTSSASRLVLGGGGGAASTNNGTGSPGSGFASSGAAGGGLIMVRAGSLIGTGTFNASGSAANNTVTYDGGGGGGAGGTVMVYAGSGLSGLSVTANGGTGGTNTGGGFGPHGPGGGGGGGYVLTTAALAGCTVSGGNNGTTEGSVAYGATAGSPGTCATGLVTANMPGSALGSGPACGATLHHYELSVPAESITCLGSTVTVTACADSSSPCTNKSTTLANQTATLATNAGTLASTTATFDANGEYSTTLSYPAAANDAVATISLSGESTTAANSRQCCQSGTCTVANSCATTFKTAGFIVAAAADGVAATVAAQTAGVGSTTYYLRAIKTDSTTKACEAALTGTTSINVAHQCDNPTTCASSDLMSVNGGSATTVARNDSASVSSYTAVNMTFDANGNAPFTFNYADVGLTQLHFSKVAGSATLIGSSTSFVVKPYGFLVSATCADGTVNTASQSSPGTGDAKFCRAGQNFAATVTAITQTGTTAPNYGRETIAETVALSWARHLPASGSDGTLPSGTPTYASNGAFGPHTVTGGWSEVGILQATAAIGDGNYLGAGNASSIAYLGRFYPDHFDVALTPQCGGFVYSGQPSPAIPGQPFTVTATAKSTADVTTSNYNTTGGFSKAIDLTLTAGGSGTGKLYVDATAGGNSAIPAANFAAGVGTVAFDAASGKISYVFDTFPTVATDITVHGADADTGTPIGTDVTDGTTNARSGRLHLLNAYGSELLPIHVPVQAEYFAGSGRWTLNTSDTCTAIPVGSVALGNRSPASLGSSPSAIQARAGSPGIWDIILTKPANAGSLDITLNLANSTAAANACLSAWTNGPSASANAGLGYLASNWCGGTYSKLPSARVRFGTPKAPFIYLRERY